MTSRPRSTRLLTPTLMLALALGACGQSTSTSAPGEGDGATPADSGSSLDDSGATGGGDGGDSSAATDTGTVAADAGSTDTGVATDAGAGGTALRFTVFGDSRDGYAVHQNVLNQMAKSNPQLIVDTGDLWAGYPTGSSQWLTITKSNANIAALLASNLYLVSRGNHETASELLNFKPTLVRGGTETYSYKIGNAFFVSAGMDPSTATASLKTALSSADATSATWRFVYSHYPIYDSGDGHGPVNGVPSVETLCDTYHVTAFFTGHEHIYERFNQIKASAVVDTSDAMKASKGTVYVVSGGGGAPFYSVTTPLAKSHMHVTNKNHFSVIDLTATTMSVQVLDVSGAQLDKFTISQ
jgi:hypothetical protein